ncbi:MAG: HD domain-containing phosphohydrolase [Planctomycetota bacterium]
MSTTQIDAETVYDPFAAFRDNIDEQRILLVDDEKVIRQSLRIFLEGLDFQVDEASNGLEAQKLLDSNDYFLVFTDITMPHMNGLDLLMYITTMEKEMDVVMITGHMNIDYAINAIKKGAFDYLKKPFLLEHVQATIMRVLEKQALKRKTIELERLKERQKIESKNLTEFMIMLANVIDAKSQFTREHSERVSEYSVMIGRKIGLDEDAIKRIALGAKLHDIGKMGTPDYILNKNGPLTDEEYNIIKEHPGKGAELIKPISSLKEIIDIIHHHHESNDGSGYPCGLKGHEISLNARIVKIADYYDAITSNRPYRKPMSREKAAEILRAEARNNRVEKDFVEAFLEQVSLLTV